MDQWRPLEARAADLGKENLLTKPDGVLLDVEHSYIPLLINLTFEDKAAKGLRKRKPGDKREVAAYFTAVEGIRDNRTLLLTGPSGAGKTTLAWHLCFSLATGSAYQGKPVIRNEEGEEHEEKWNGSRIVPRFVTVDSLDSLHSFAEGLPNDLQAWSDRGKTREKEEILFILDSIENSGNNALEILSSIVNSIRAAEGSRLLVLGRQEEVQNWILPPGLARQQILPLLKSQRLRSISLLEIRHSSALSGAGFGRAAALPALFAMSHSCMNPGETNEGIIDAWMEKHIGSESQHGDVLADAYNTFYGRGHGVLSSMTRKWPFISSRSIRDLLIAKYLVSTPENILRLLSHDSLAAQPILRSLLHRLPDNITRRSLIHSMLRAENSLIVQRVALVAADFLEGQEDVLKLSIRSKMLEILEEGTLSTPERVIAGHILSRLGDPRELDALAIIPEGKSIHGSTNHPNSAPPHELKLGEFRIGIFPIVNAIYRRFIQETGRTWVSPDGADPETQNTPATDLTWHDAQAFCEWLTSRWRKSGKIGPTDIVNLPTEPQWERACRGNQVEAYPGQIIYPWGTKWASDASNCEELALNNKCAVGLFPNSSSPFGCYDMTGQVWEWCTTLWGSDMATPSYKYPWTDQDGREEIEAEESIRRVLRGGCFSSGEMKANCTYRGSLEPAGFWRGNGFRIVVVPSAVK